MVQYVEENIPVFNLFTYEQLLASMKTHERIAVRKVNAGDFQDFDAFLNSFDKKLACRFMS